MTFPAIHELVKTPVLDVVRVVVLKNDKVLLVKEADDPNWKLPGGKTHAGETVFEAAVREIHEELGFELLEEDILSYIPKTIPNSKHIRHIFLLREISEGKIADTDEVEETAYFSVADLPDTKFKEHIATAVGFVKSQ